MAKKGTLTVRVVSDTKAAEQGLDRFNTKVSSTGDKLQSAGKKMTMFATIPVAAAMGVATKAASDLQQAVGGTEAVFGDAADAVDDFASEAASAAGLSEREFREATTSIGGQLKRMTGDVDLAAEQSIELTRVAADLAATYGGTTAEAVAALGSAFRGEADPAERFNLNLKIGAVNAKAVELGLAATTSEVDDNARAQATLALIMEQSADAQGQFAREADSAAGSMQIAKAEMENASAEIGSNLLPLVADAAGGIADLAQKFGQLPDPLQKSILGLAGVVAIAGPVTGAVGTVITGFGKARDAAGKAGDAFDTLRLRSMYLAQGFGGPAGLVAGLGAVGALVGTGAILYQDYADTKNEARRITDLYTDALKSENDELEESIDKVGAAELASKDYATAIRESGVGFDVLVAGVRDAGGAIESLDDDLRPLLRGVYSMEEALERAGLSGTDLGDALAVLKDRLSAGQFDDLINDLDGLSDRYDETTEKTRNQAAADRDLAGATDEAASAQDAAKGPTEDLGDAAGDAASSHEQLADAISRANDAVRASIDPLFGAQDALRRNQEAQWDVQEATEAVAEARRHENEVIAEFGRKSPEAAYAAQEVAHAERLLADANRETSRTALDVETATNELGAKLREQPALLIDAKNQLHEWADQGLITEDQARQVAGEFDEIARQAGALEGKSIDIPVSADTSAYERAIAELYARTNPDVRISVGGSGGIPIRHTGGPVQGGRMYLTSPGEAFVPHADGQVLSPAKTRDALAPAGVVHNNTFNIYEAQDLDEPAIAHHLASFLARR